MSVVISLAQLRVALFLTFFALFPLLVRSVEVNSTASHLKGGYIVEFETAQSSSSFYSSLSNHGIAATARTNISYPLFHGVSFSLNNLEDEKGTVSRISSMAMVKDIWPIRLYKRPATVVTKASTTSTDIINEDLTNDTYAPHVMGGVDKLRAEGYTGEGLFVAIVDTGVDYNHPALGGGFGSGYKIAYGYDLVGDDYDGSNTPVPDSDPYSECEGHGTHVAGIVGANPNEYSFTGVVPNATLGMYRVFGCYDSAGDDVLIDAFMMAYEAGADVITASIGGASGWGEEAWSVAVSRIVAAGTPCMLANGNDGDMGLYYASAAATGHGVTAVGSIDSVTSPLLLNVGYYTTNSSNSSEIEFGYELGTGDFPNATLPLWALNYNTSVTADGCSSYPTDTPDLSGKVVLIKRGTCTFDSKITYAKEYGAEYVLFYNNVATGVTTPSISVNITAAGMVTEDQGVEWIALLKAGYDVELTVTETAYAGLYYEIEENTETGGYMSTYSTWGPTFENYIKPYISAPGANILSTYPLVDGGYAVLSGTSMATPYVAGVVALLKQIRGSSITPETINALLGTTGSALAFNDGSDTYDYVAPVAQQGGGLIDAYTAAHTTSILSTPHISFNDTEYFLGTVSFSIKNTDSTSVSYSFSNKGAATAYTLDSALDTTPQVFPPDMVTSYATLSFSSNPVTIVAGSSANVSVTLTPPADIETDRIPVYSGFIAINGTNGDSLSLPYAGVDFAMINATILDTANGYPYVVLSTTSSDMPSGQVFTISKSNSTSSSAAVPELIVNLAMGSALVRVDVVPVNGTGSTYSNTTEILGVNAYGPIDDYPLTYLPRSNAWASEWYGTLADGTYVPAGTYKFLVRALKIFGDASEGSDYESWYSDPFVIKYTY